MTSRLYLAVFRICLLPSLFSLVVPSLWAVDRARCDGSVELEKMRGMFRGRKEVLGKQLLVVKEPFTPESRIECAGDIEYREAPGEPSPLNIIQLETGRVGEFEYRVSYFNGSGYVTSNSGGTPWSISCSVDDMTDKTACFVSRTYGLWTMKVFPVKELSFSAGGSKRHPGSEIGFRVDRLPAHQTLGPVLAGADAAKLLAEMQAGRELLVRWVEWPTNKDIDARVPLDDGLSLALKLARWAGSHTRP